jgi:hypothetical protein
VIRTKDEIYTPSNQNPDSNDWASKQNTSNDPKALATIKAHNATKAQTLSLSSMKWSVSK